jgi:OPT family oligopeptide transporter
MAPDRGRSSSVSSFSDRRTRSRNNVNASTRDSPQDDSRDTQASGSQTRRRKNIQKALAERADEPQNFTFRGVIAGLLIGIVICFSNMYFGLQTGWISSMSMPSALIGFAYFKAVARTLKLPFSPVENVLIQSVAGSVGTMPLGCGFVGVIPALNYLLKPEENGPLNLSTWKLVVWAVGICFFGVVFAVPLRKEVIIKEKLKFPSGTATALMIGVLHGEKDNATIIGNDGTDRDEPQHDEETENLLPSEPPNDDFAGEQAIAPSEHAAEWSVEWKTRIKLLIIAFAGSSLYTILSYFIPQLRGVPIFGLPLARDWLWTLNPSPAYVGQGIIMGPATTNHMLLGAIIGWGILSPLAKRRGWAPGPVSDWETGSKGWIVWISLAIMLADSLVSLGWLILRPLIYYGRLFAPSIKQHLHNRSWKDIATLNFGHTGPEYSRVHEEGSAHSMTSNPLRYIRQRSHEDTEPDAPPEHLISARTTIVGLGLSLVVCIIAVHVVFPGLIPFPLTLLSLVFAFVLSIMGVRALGETDLNPVSGISKITQLLFALITPTSNKNAVIINLIAGAVSESGAIQAGDLLQDLKTGHLLGAAPNAQFWGQIIGSAVGAVLSALIYKLYTNVYQIPGGLFQVPTGYVWVFTARLVTGDGLPPMVGQWAAGAGAIWAVGTAMRVYGNARKAAGRHAKWLDFVPGGIAVAVGELPCHLVSLCWYDICVD